MTRGRCLLRISIPHNLANQIFRVGRDCGISNLIYIVHVDIVVAIIAHENYGILPTASILVFYIADSLVDHNLGFSLCSYRETTNGNVGTVGRQEVCTLAIVEKTIETIVGIASSFRE